MKSSIIASGAFLFTAYLCSWAQDSQPSDKLARQARQEYDAAQFREAERDFRKIARRDPTNIYAQFFLGQSLFRQEKYADAISSYEKARDLLQSGKILSLEQKRILTDQLAMAYGMGGQLEKARVLLEEAARKDPDYPLNYYNLACAFAEKGDKDKMLANLSLAFRYRANMLTGEQFPDPRADSSFQKYVHDSDFIRLMNEMGYQ